MAEKSIYSAYIKADDYFQIPQRRLSSTGGLHPTFSHPFLSSLSGSGLTVTAGNENIKFEQRDQWEALSGIFSTPTQWENLSWMTFTFNYSNQLHKYQFTMEVHQDLWYKVVAAVPDGSFRFVGRVQVESYRDGYNYGQQNSRNLKKKFDVRMKCVDYPENRTKIVNLLVLSSNDQLITNNQQGYPLGVKLSVLIEWADAKCGRTLPPTASSPMKLCADSILRKLLTYDPTKDITILVGDGARIKCHRLILAANSPVLAAMVASSSEMKEAQTGTIEIKEGSEKGMTLFVQYLYGVEIEPGIICDIAIELFQAAHKYEIVELEEALDKLLLKKNKGWFTPDALLELYFFVRNLQGHAKLEARALQIMTKIPKEIQSCDRFKELDPRESVNLLWQLFELK